MCNQSAWFAKEDDVGCWMGFVDTESKNGREKSTDERKWIIFTATEVLYIASTADGKISSPREGLWELGEKGAAWISFDPPTADAVATTIKAKFDHALVTVRGLVDGRP